MPKRKAYTLKSAKAKDGSLAIELDNKSKFFLERGSKPVAPRVFTFRWWYTLILVGLFLLGVVGSFLFRAIQQFESAAQTNVWGVAGVVWAGLRQPYFQNHDRLTILLLGVDAVPNRQDTSILTDTMIILSIEPDARIKSVSLPRDLYIPELATKINSLYETGLLTGEPLSSNPVKSVISSITGVEIDYVMVVKLTTVKDLIDATGGIPITVVKSFEDEQYPKDDVDLTSTDPAVLYETVRFSAGPTVMDGDTALKFIRSRHSADLEEGNDDARIRRQQLVLTSLMNQLMEKGTHFNPTFWGKLYLIWKTQVETDIPDSVLVGVGRSLIGKEVTHFQTQIPTQEGPEGLLENPPLTKYGAWVYEARDPTWEELHAWFTATLLE